MCVGTTLQEPALCRTSEVETAPDSAGFDMKTHKREPKRARDLTCLYPWSDVLIRRRCFSLSEDIFHVGYRHAFLSEHTASDVSQGPGPHPFIVLGESHVC